MAGDPRAQTGDSAGGLVHGRPTDLDIVRDVSRVPLRRRSSRTFLLALGFAFALVMVLFTGIAWLLARGVGVWGIRIPVAWGFAIVNFVWWIGIGHAGTLISAILLLFRQEWRTSVNRFAEAMTLFAVANAGLFPLLHLGRIAKFYYLLPYPSKMGVWPQWRSPLTWDIIAVLTYGTVSLIFWYVGLIPDLATMRDTARRRWSAKLYGLFALGWRGTAMQWRHHQSVYLIMAGLATPLVVSVHSIVSLDFSVAMLPGWHSTIFPPYFVAGAIFSGFAMVFTIAIPLRRWFHFEHLVTTRHLNAMAKIMLASGLIVAYGYVMESFTALFSGNLFEQYMLINRATGPYAHVFWIMLSCNIAIPQLLWLRRVRVSPSALFMLSIVINTGMWIERYVIVITSLHRDYVPSAWDTYAGTIWDWALLVGSLGFFLLLFLLFLRIVPAISMSEVRRLVWKRGNVGDAEGDTP